MPNTRNKSPVFSTTMPASLYQELIDLIIDEIADFDHKTTLLMVISQIRSQTHLPSNFLPPTQTSIQRETANSEAREPY
jgi:hypothetical protein